MIAWEGGCGFDLGFFILNINRLYKHKIEMFQQREIYIRVV